MRPLQLEPKRRPQCRASKDTQSISGKMNGRGLTSVLLKDSHTIPRTEESCPPMEIGPELYIQANMVVTVSRHGYKFKHSA